MGSRTWRGMLAEVERGGGAGGEDGGTAVQWRRRRLEDGGVARTAKKNPWPGQGVAAVVAAATAVGLLPRPSLSSHLRGRELLSFFKCRLGFVGGSLPLL